MTRPEDNLRSWADVRDLIGKLRVSGIPEWEIDAATADAALQFCTVLERTGATAPTLSFEADAVKLHWPGWVLIVEGRDDGVASVVEIPAAIRKGGEHA